MDDIDKLNILLSEIIELYKKSIETINDGLPNF